MKYRLAEGYEVDVEPALISKRILQAIEKSELTYQQLEEKTNIPKSAIQRYASGQTKKIPDGRIFAIARATHTSIMYLLGQTDVMDEEPTSGGLTITAPPKPDFIVYNGKTSMLFEMSNKMSDEQLKRLISYGEFLLSQEE